MSTIDELPIPLFAELVEHGGIDMATTLTIAIQRIDSDYFEDK